MNTFKLLSLKKSNPDIFDSTNTSGDIDLQFIEFDSTLKNFPKTNHFTILIGKNGIGKSRSLGKIADIFGNAFNELSNYKISSVRKYRNDLDWDIYYSTNGHKCRISTFEAYANRTSSESKDPLENFESLPRKVIALATTATDKFPLKPFDRPESENLRDERYSYIGFKDRFGRSSPTYAMQRALEALTFSDQKHDRKLKISQIFDFLGYLPEIRHVYRWRISLRRNGSTVQEILNNNGEGNTMSRIKNSLLRLIEEDPQNEFRINSIIRKFTRLEHSGQIAFLSDFRLNSKVDQTVFKDIKLLRQIGIISFFTIELSRINSVGMIDFREISSGELSILTSFLGLSSTIENGSLILIDEPEVSLHPEWQSKYLALLNETFSTYTGCHFIIATHSPILLSGAPPENSNTIRIGYYGKDHDPKDSFAGESTDEVLFKAFEIAGNNNLYLRKIVVEALRLIADGEKDSARLSEIIDEIFPVMNGMDKSSPVYDLLLQIVSVHDGAWLK